MDEFIKENEETVASESVSDNGAQENQNNIGEENTPPIENTETVENSEAEAPAMEEGIPENPEPAPYYSEPFEDKTSENFAPVYNPINYSPVEQVKDYKPMSKGLKIFALIMAAIILLSGTTYAGYYIGKNSTVFTSTNSKVKLNLASKPADTDELTPAQVYEKVDKSIVGIMIYNSSGKGGQASGIVFSEDGYIVTNDHIYSEVPAAKFKIYTHDGKEYDAKYVAGDVISDLAVLKIDAKGFTPATFGNSDELFYGENVVAIGRPSDATDKSSITKGIISAVNRRIQTTSSYSARLIQTDSAINPGSSGGALVNMYGQVVGVTASKLASVEYDAVGYAIPTTIMKRIVEELIAEGKVVSRAKLGVSYTAIDSVAVEIGEYATKGLLLAEVSEDSDLHGKVEKGDYITHINDIEVTSDDIVLDIIENSRAGDTITVTVKTKDGKDKTVEAVLKANIGESSYVLTESEGNKDGIGGGTFDFPDGE